MDYIYKKRSRHVNIYTNKHFFLQIEMIYGGSVDCIVHFSLLIESAIECLYIYSRWIVINFIKRATHISISIQVLMYSPSR